MVGEGQCRLTVLVGSFKKTFYLGSAVKDRILGVYVEVDK
jgi:hypothetical protein